MSNSPVILWFRRDLRLTDHPALHRALSSGSVLPLFIVDPAFQGAGGPRQAALFSALEGLRTATDGALAIRHGKPAQVLVEIAGSLGAKEVHVSRDYGPYGHARDAEVAAALREIGCRLIGTGSNYLVPPGGVLKDDGTPYAVFTPFRRRWKSVLSASESLLLDAPVDPNWVTLDSGGEALLRPESGLADDRLVNLSVDAVLHRWQSFSQGALHEYADLRDIPAVDGTSRLSTALRFGAVHPARLMNDLDPSSAHHDTFESELAWRDFYADVLARRPDSAWANLDSKLNGIVVDTDATARQKFDVWAQGMTGFPIVDAGMRQLAATGWMHNRVRMIVASFLVKDLHLPWQWGAKWFMDHLVDGDLASNNHGWQWAAGTGTDAAPYFRVFNPTAQGDRWDPSGVYQSQWIPELGSDDYPAPMVDHGEERKEALRRYEAARSR
ncbi:MAG: cryptochrome/photolyase family protein [Ilumatobacteraceae bacterium]